MLDIDLHLRPTDLAGAVGYVFDLSARKLRLQFERWDPAQGSPVVTVEGRYRPCGWTEWTLGFFFGSALLQYEATGEEEFLERGKKGTLEHMVPHLVHTGIHDHGFQIAGTYGILLRLAARGRIEALPWEIAYYRTALRVSGAVQAARWTELKDGYGYIHSFNGPHSLFIDTMRTLRSLALAHRLGQYLPGENDERINLFHRLLRHARTTARYNVSRGDGRDRYDERGRTAQEAVFNVRNGSFRCLSTHQGYSPFSTWTRGLAWAVCGFAEILEFCSMATEEEFPYDFDKDTALTCFESAVRDTIEYYIAHVHTDGIPYWDTAAPGLRESGVFLEKKSDPFNDVEPIDSSAAVVAAQGMLRFALYLERSGRSSEAATYRAAGLTIARTLFDRPYLSTGSDHEGLILHSVYHYPKGWDYVPPGKNIPCGESSQWGDYHARELALIIRRMGEGTRVPTFFDGLFPDDGGVGNAGPAH
ncbi:MAG: glycosyl hydrolase [Bacteroidota bacterium]|nr:glycosyl hydrolase [Bacteroidota bacterium]